MLDETTMFVINFWLAWYIVLFGICSLDKILSPSKTQVSGGICYDRFPDRRYLVLVTIFHSDEYYSMTAILVPRLSAT